MNTIFPLQSWMYTAESDAQIVGAILGVLAAIGFAVLFWLV